MKAFWEVIDYGGRLLLLYAVFYRPARSISTALHWAKALAIALCVSTFFGFLAARNLGTHTESDDDPLMGRTETVEDFAPTSKQAEESFCRTFGFVFGACAIGIYRSKSASAQ